MANEQKNIQTGRFCFQVLSLVFFKINKVFLVVSLLTILLGSCTKKNSADESQTDPNLVIFAEIIGTWSTACTAESDGTYSLKSVVFGAGTVRLTILKQASTIDCSDGFRLIADGTMTLGVKSTDTSELNLKFLNFSVVPDSGGAALALVNIGTSGGNSGSMPGSGGGTPSSGSDTASGACSINSWVQNQSENVTYLNCSNIDFVTAPYTLYTIYVKDASGIKLGTSSGSNDGLTTEKRYNELGASLYR